MTHLTAAQLAAVTPEQIAHAIAAHAKRDGITVAEWVDREIAKSEEEET